MNLVEKASKRKEHYKENKANRLEGKHVGVPLYKYFPKLGVVMPTIPKQTQIMFTAGSGVGKSQAWLGLILYPTYKLIKAESIKVLFVIHLLEDSIDFLIDRLYSCVAFNEFNVELDSLYLNSMKSDVLSDKDEELLNKIEPIVADILSYCKINDSIFNSTGIYKFCRNISNDLGSHVYKTAEFKSTGKNNKEKITKKQVYSHYDQIDKDLQIINIVDNLNNIEPEKKAGGTALLTERETINKMTRTYGRLQMMKHWGWTNIFIMQQSADSEDIQFTNSGINIIEKVEPSLRNLGNSKECQRDMIFILGLFSPERFSIKNYFGFDITKYQDEFRSLKMLKSNVSQTNKRIPFRFKGNCSTFIELDKP